jgi:hypothetical protein
MPHREQLAFLRQCEADAVERGHEAIDPVERELHFETAAEYVTQIMAIERASRTG